jgi:hypothetical protein
MPSAQWRFLRANPMRSIALQNLLTGEGADDHRASLSQWALLPDPASQGLCPGPEKHNGGVSLPGTGRIV